jgi:integrase
VLEDLKAEQRDGLQLARQSLGDYLRSWLDETARPTISANTYRGYEDVLAHLAPIANIPLRDLAAFNQMIVRRGKSDEPSSAKTVRNAQIMVRRALRSAEMRGHVRRNVALQVPLRRVPRNPRPALTPDVARRILAAFAGDRYEAAFALAFIGLREGENSRPRSRGHQSPVLHGRCALRAGRIRAGSDAPSAQDRGL